MLKLSIVKKVISLSTIPNFLTEINNRIQAISNQIENANKEKNTLLYIENLFFEYGIEKNSLSMEDLLKIPSDSFKEIMEVLGVPDVDMQESLFSKHVEVVKLHDNIVKEHGEIKVAEQYKEAEKWLKHKTAVINSWIRNASNDKITSLNESYEEFRKITDYFRGNELVKPILETEEFNRILALCGFSILEIALIKKEVGIITLELMIPTEVKKAPKDELEKYKTILENKKEIHKEFIPSILTFITEQNLTLELKNLEEQIVYVALQKKDIY